ncbi:hypothetical protein K1T71_006380 [Dendrolimus kikuchii]|uniref:Uncharacterized protein n=1 Tax=Dendrolimus kikuchii TaxID=765133 RepID=A0ACC1D4W2_9NEOP|nr:hypothetical protein K1T71_006380 [Dendrolimus kikuchii]
MTLAADLGVEDLRAACEDHVTSTLSVESACTLLAAAMEIQDRPGGKSASSFMERCITFIGDNAADCVKTNAFLNLPKEALVKLISSDFLCLEEEEVWRCALAWAKQRAGVTQPTAHWTEEERARVCHHLAPLMQHVRLLLIDSAVFAEEVEPTGAVPMELSLERYRRAALHAAPHPHQPDKRTQPRCGSPKQCWQLVFRASTHGFSAQAFHKHCDGVAPLLLLVQLSRGEVIGGYSETAWSAGAAGAAGGYIPAERAFLFALGEPPARYTLLKKAFALCYHTDCGPIFGAGADLLIASNCNTNSDSYSNLHSYGDPLAPASLAPEYNFTAANMSVCPINVTIDDVPDRVPRRIKFIKCADTPNRLCTEHNMSHGCCRKHHHVKHDHTMRSYVTECVEINDWVQVTYRNNPKPSQILVPVGCSCVIQEATTVKEIS